MPEDRRRPAALAELGHVHVVMDSHGVYSLVSAHTAVPRRWRSVQGAPGPRVLFEVRESLRDGVVVAGLTGAGTEDTGAGRSGSDTGASSSDTTGGA